MPLSILIADDYADNRELLRLILEADGYAIREARDGRECISMAQEEPPDLVLVDLSMPELDGWETLRELRNDARTRHIPCIAVSAFASLDPKRPFNEGFDAYLSKPYRSRDLLDMVKKLFAERDGKAQPAKTSRASTPVR